MKRRMDSLPLRQNGQVLMEYVLIVSVVALVMFLPMPSDIGAPAAFVGKTPAEVLAFAFKNFFRGFSFLTSVL